MHFNGISKIFNKDESSLSRYNSIIENKVDKPKTDFEKNVISLFDGFLQTRLNSFEEQLNKLEPTE